MTREMKRYFELNTDKSSKFWEIHSLGGAVTIRYGKIGTVGQSQAKVFENEVLAMIYSDKAMGEKLEKGYIEIGVKGEALTDIVAISESSKVGSKNKGATVLKSAEAQEQGKAKNIEPEKNPETSPEVLDKLYDRDVVTDRLLALHPLAGADLLEKLSHSKDKTTRKSVTLHPNTPKEVLIKLAQQFPGEFFKNPSLDWLLLEDPDLMFNLGGGILKNILKRAECPISMMEWALKKGSEDEQLALIMNASAPNEIIKTLARRKGKVGEAAKGRQESKSDTSTSDIDLDDLYITEVKKALGEVKADEVKSAWKRNMVTNEQWPWLTLDCRLLVTDVSLDVVIAGAMESHEAELATHSEAGVRAIVARFLVDQIDLMEALANDKSHHVRIELARNPNCVDSVRKLLLMDKNHDVREAVVRNLNVKQEELEILSKDRDAMVRASVAWSPRLSNEVLEQLLVDSSPVVKKTAKIREKEFQVPASNPNTDPEELKRIATSAKGATKAILAANPATPIDNLASFVAEANPALDKILLKNPSLSTDLTNLVYERQLEEAGPNQRIKMLGDPCAPRTVREGAAERVWKEHFPKSQNWHQDAYNFLYAPWSGYEPSALLDIPKGMESQFAGSALRAARLLGLAHPLTAIEILIKRSNSVDWAERLSISRNTSTPTNLLTKLKSDKNLFVALQAIATESAKKNISEHHKDVLLKTTVPTDWSAILDLINQEITKHEVRTWEWYGTPWWTHLSVKQRIGYYNHAERWGPSIKADIQGFFTDSPFSMARLATSCVPIISEWLAEFNNTPLKVLEGMYESKKNLAAQRNWLARVISVDDPHLSEKLRFAANESVSIDSKWASLINEIMKHECTPEDAKIKIAMSASTSWQAKQFLNIKGIPEAARQILVNVCEAEEVAELSAGAMDSKAVNRERVASNHRTPDHILNLLTRDKNKEVRQAAELTIKENAYFNELAIGFVARENYPAAFIVEAEHLLNRLSDFSTAFKSRVLESIDFPPFALEYLSKQKDLWSIGRLLAINPKSPESVLIRLSKLYRKSDYPHDLSNYILSKNTLSSVVLQTLLDSKSMDVKIRTINSPHAHIDLLIGMESNSDSIVRKAIAQRQDINQKVIHILARDEEPEVRKAVAQRGDIDTDTRVQLSLDSNPDIASAALYHRNLSEDFYRRYINAGGRKFHPNCIENISSIDIWRIIIDEGEEFRGFGNKTLKVSISEQRDIPVEVLIYLSSDSDKHVVASAIKHPLIPEDIMRKVMQGEESIDVLKAVQRNPFAPFDLVEASVKKIGADRFWSESWFAKKHSGSDRADQLKTYLLSVMEWARDPRTPIDRLRMFASSGIWIVRWAVSSNPSMPRIETDEIRRKLWSEVEEALFENNTYAMLPESINEEVICSALDRLDLLPKVDDKKAIAEAAKSQEVLRRVAAALNPDIQPNLLKLLLDDPVDFVRSLSAEKLRAIEAMA